MTVDRQWIQHLQPRMPRRAMKVVYTPYDRPWTWKPLHRAYRQKYIQQVHQTRMAEMKRSEAVLRNLASELLTEDECYQFKQALHHFRVSHSVTSLCQQLKQVIDNTEKLLLLVELSSRLPRNLQEDFHRLCSLQYSNYDTYLRIFTNGNASHEIPRMVAQDSTGRYKMISRGSEKKIYMKYNNARNVYELYSLPGTSVTSGVYSEVDDDESEDDIKNDEGYMTPTHLKGKNVRRVFLKRHDDGSLGLGIIGGKEFGKMITINVVEEGGPAAAQGLQVGDKILEVNGHSFLEFTHAEAVTVMRNAWNLIMMVESPQKLEKAFDWPDHGYRRMEEVELVVYPSSEGKMGCTTQRLRNRNLIIKEIEDHSPAQKAGLKIKDQVVKMDNIRVADLSEKQIVMLTRAKRLILVVRREVTEIVHETNESQRNHAHGTVSSSNSGGIPPEKQRRVNGEDGEEIHSNSGRDHSPESRRSSHKDKGNSRPRSRTPVSQRYYYRDHPEHLVYPTRHGKDGGNWVLTPKPREHRYTQRKDTYSRDYHQYPIHPRSYSEGQYELRSRYALRDGLIQGGGVSRYVRNKSQSSHRSTLTVRQIQNEDQIIRAIQQGLEKRQRAIRLSLYQMTDPADYEWEI